MTFDKRIIFARLKLPSNTILTSDNVKSLANIFFDYNRKTKKKKL